MFIPFITLFLKKLKLPKIFIFLYPSRLSFSPCIISIVALLASLPKFFCLGLENLCQIKNSPP
ncbi:MAG: hypothetical protein CMP34_02940 [Rickettsiales bacterium]|nr:hypothetical protein [Rickettsiales bacterium]